MRIKTVFLMSSGMTVVFDENGDQVPELQGMMFETMEKIGKTADIETTFYLMDINPSDLKWWFERRDSPLMIVEEKISK